MNETDSKPYLLGTDQMQAWMKKDFFAPRGIGFLEPGGDAPDSAALSAYNIAKSSYQIRPDVFNMDYLEKETGLERTEIMNRILRMYRDRLAMFVKNSPVQATGFGLWYWLVKLKDGTPPEKKAELAEWFQNKDDICTGYETEGDFDFFNGNHMRVLDNLLADVIGPWRNNPEVEYVHLCPVRRDIRESNVNMFDAPGDGYREFIFPEEQLDKLSEIQDQLDRDDLRIISALNKKRPVEEFFDFDVLADVSGLDPEQLKADIKRIIEEKRTLVPLWHLDFPKLGLTNHMFVIRLFQNIPCYRKAEIVDELSKMPEFNTVFEYTDSFYDMGVWAYKELTDLEKLRTKLQEYSEIETILEADVPRQFRRWVCRLDDDHDYWEECVFTDDILEDWTAARNSASCRFSAEAGK